MSDKWDLSAFVRPGRGEERMAWRFLTLWFVGLFVITWGLLGPEATLVAVASAAMTAVIMRALERVR